MQQSDISLRINELYRESKLTQEQSSTTEGLPLLPYNAMAGALSGTSLSAMEYECEHYVVRAFHNADFLVRATTERLKRFRHVRE